MTTKLQQCRELADFTATRVTGSYQSWTDFLTTAARLYKYPYHEQLMIYAQRPEATACADYELWNKRMGRYVRRGAKGIALIDHSGDYPRIKYVFDVANTGGNDRSRSPYLWEYRPEHEKVVSAALEEQFTIPNDGNFTEQLEQISGVKVAEYWLAHQQDILGIVDGSYLQGYHDYDIGVAFLNAATVSTTYALLSRCGLNPDAHFDPEAFMPVFDFNTPQAVYALGSAVSEISETVLRSIEVAIKKYEREKQSERSQDDERTDLHPQRGLLDSRSDPVPAGSEALGQVREDAEEISSGASPGTVEQPDPVGEAVPPSKGDRRDSEPAVGADDAPADESRRGDGSSESQRPHEVGRADEQSEGPGRGSDSGRAGVRLTPQEPEPTASGNRLAGGISEIPWGTEELPIQGEQFSFFPTEAEQIQTITEAESATKAPFAFSIPQEDIEQILRFGSNTENSRMRVTTEFRKQKNREEVAAFLKQEYHGGYGIKGRDGDVSAWYAEDGIHLSMGLGAKDVPYAQILSWEDAAAHIGEMLESGTFSTNVELEEAPGFERRQMAQTLWYLRHDMSEEATGRGFLPTMKAIRGSNAPDETQSLTELLKDPARVDGIIAELEAFAEAHVQDKKLMRFQFYKPSVVLGQLRELTLPRREYASGLVELPRVESFITEDEISQVLAGGSNVEGSKGRIYAYFTADHTLKEQITFLKDEYGIGGHSHGVSGADGSFEDHSGKGIRLQKRGCVDVELSWNKAAKRINALIREGKYLTPEEQDRLRQKSERDSLYRTYNDVKREHPDDMVLFQVGDFFELYGEDARQASELLGLHLASRNIPNVGRVDMCGVPAHALEGYVEKFRAQFDVTVSAVPEGGKERGAYTLRAFERETEHAADTPEVESETEQPTVAELLEQYKPIVTAAVTEDRPYRNACGHSDRENAAIECNAAVRRAVLNSGNLELIRAFSDVPEFRQRLHREVFDETYFQLYELLRPLSQDDIDNALRAWNGDMASKRAVVRYMEAHARDRDTAAWLSREYGGDEGKAAFPVRAGSPESVALPWAKVQRRIAQLIQKDAFFTEEERDNFEDIDPVAIRERLESGEPSPFVERVMADVEQIAARNEVTPYERFTVIETDEGYGVWDDLHNGLYVDEDGVTADFDSEWVAEDYLKELREKVSRQGSEEWLYAERSKNAIEPAENEPEPTPSSEVPEQQIEAAEMEPVPQIQNDSGLVGMELTLDGRRFVVDEITGDRASLRDITFQNGTGFPIFRNESVQTVRDILYPEQRSVQHVNLTAQVTDAQLERMRQQLNAAGIDYLVTRAGYNSNSISFSSQYYREVQAMLDALPEEPEQPRMTSETEAVYPGEKTGLPYDIVMERLRTEPEHTPPEPGRPNEENEVLDADTISVQVGGEWRPFPNRDAAEDAMYADFKDRTHRDAQNFRITDDNLGVGGAKTKYRANINAISLLKHLESEGMQASPEQQEVLSRYVGWGGLPDAFDPDKANWAAEYEELKSLLTPAEYEAARASTLNAHYTSPTVIKAIYEAVENMGFRTGNILEPSMGVGNFFGLLPDTMAGSRLYGVELDSITGRIAKQLYPKANITVAGFETTDRRDFFDLAVGNVPFGSYQVNDRAYNKLGFSIHDYFFAKALDQVRPGGVIAFVTSRYTMDKQSPEVRKYIAQRAELLGAIRLPNTAFKANAGTEVVSDILFLQKRDRPIEIEPDWVHLGVNDDGFSINSYFVEHPEMMLGRQTSENTQYGKQDFTVVPIEGADLTDQLHEAVGHIHGTYQEAELPDLGEGEAIQNTLPADPDVKNFSYTLVDGEVYFRENSIMVRPDLNATAKERIKGMLALSTCVHELIDLQMDETIPDSAIAEKQGELNRLYDSFTEKYGLINSRGNKLAFSDDSSYFLLCALEVMDDDGNFQRKADMFTKRTIQPHRVVTSVDTASEALTLSIAEKAEVDMAYMSSLTGKTAEELASELRGVIFHDPTLGNAEDGMGWVTADEYLSGNVRQKLRQAEAAAAENPAYQVNVEALRAAQPKDLDASEIEVRLGATWIDKSYIKQFMFETFDTPKYLRYSMDVQYSPYTAAWSISNKNRISFNDVAAWNTYGTSRVSAYEILEDSLNLRDVQVYDTIEDADGHKKRVLNAKETTLASQKQQLIRDAFRDWIWAEPNRRQALVRQYNEEMNSTRPREYDGSHIVFAGMNPEITLREHQRNAIAHVLYGGNTLLAHEVGAGKTFEMVAAAMESKRLGLCQKSIFVVPNHLTEQWSSEFLRLYPSANILVTKQRDFETKNRKKFCARIATGDYDAVIIGHSQFEKIPISRERQERLLQDQIAEITMGISELKESGGEKFSVKELERTKRGLETRLEKLRADDKKDDVVTFEELGVDRMFVDEAHNYKNLFLYTKMRNVAGLSTTDAQKSSDMFGKCRYMDELTGNRGVVFATGTPVSNSMTELYTMQRYLQYARLEEMHMTHFDCWASRFGETVTALELAPEGKGYRPRTRFSRFFNLPELMNLFKEVADIKTADQLHLPVPEVEYHNVVAKPTEVQKGLVQELSERAAAIHSGSVDPSIDNMLKVTSDGRKLGLDQRIINPDFPDAEGSKVNLCVENILQVWKDGAADKLTQLVFCDISTPQAAPKAKKAVGTEFAISPLPVEENAPFTVYDDIRSKLIARGVPAEQIAFIHDANTEVKKKELFGKVRSGQVRVLMGSTSKMGAGTNVQDRLVAIHDVDCPWRPGDLQQRKGRIERQGNQNEKVHVFRYVTEGTFDSFLWQTVENKQKFISQIMSSKSPVRSCDDVDEVALSFAEIKALCAGDPRIKERMDLDVEVSKLKIMKADYKSKQYRLEDNLLRHFPEQIEKLKGYIQAIQEDMRTLEAHPHPTNGFAGMTVLADNLTDKDNAGAALIEAAKKATGLDPVEIGTYRGFKMSVTLEDFGKKYVLTMQGRLRHQATLGSDPRGNLIRLDNALAQMPQRLKAFQTQLDETCHQREAAKAELGKPFPYEEELRDKTARLIFLDAELNLDANKGGQQEQVVAKASRPSVLDKLRSQPVPSRNEKKHKHHEEVR